MGLAQRIRSLGAAEVFGFFAFQRAAGQSTPLIALRQRFSRRRLILESALLPLTSDRRLPSTTCRSLNKVHSSRSDRQIVASPVNDLSLPPPSWILRRNAALATTEQPKFF